MGMMINTGGARTYNDINMMYTEEVAVLMDNAINKYEPGMHVFKLQSISGLQPDSAVITTETRQLTLMNLDTEGIAIDYVCQPVNKAACVRLWVPVSVTRTYCLGNDNPKFIPRGTRFIVGFIGGDFTKDPVILRGEWEDVNDLSRA